MDGPPQGAGGAPAGSTAAGAAGAATPPRPPPPAPTSVRRVGGGYAYARDDNYTEALAAAAAYDTYRALPPCEGAHTATDVAVLAAVLLEAEAEADAAAPPASADAPLQQVRRGRRWRGPACACCPAWPPDCKARLFCRPFCRSLARLRPPPASHRPRCRRCCGHTRGCCAARGWTPRPTRASTAHCCASAWTETRRAGGDASSAKSPATAAGTARRQSSKRR